MKTNKKSEASIALIVAAVIGLIILVVIIAMLGGKLGAFGKGTTSSSDCATVCKATGIYTDGSTSGTATPGIVNGNNQACSCS